MKRLVEFLFCFLSLTLFFQNISYSNYINSKNTLKKRQPTERRYQSEKDLENKIHYLSQDEAPPSFLEITKSILLPFLTFSFGVLAIYYKHRAQDYEIAAKIYNSLPSVHPMNFVLYNAPADDFLKKHPTLDVIDWSDEKLIPILTEKSEQVDPTKKKISLVLLNLKNQDQEIIDLHLGKNTSIEKIKVLVEQNQSHFLDSDFQKIRNFMNEQIKRNNNQKEKEKEEEE